MTSNIKTNMNHQVFIALVPSGDTEENKKYTELTYMTDFTLNRDIKTESVTFYHNKGEPSTYITGKTESYSITIMLNTAEKTHAYLLGLAYGNALSGNNQYIKFVINNGVTGKKTNISGKCAIEVKSLPPSGKPDELQTLQFNVYAQDLNMTREEVS